MWGPHSKLDPVSAHAYRPDHFPPQTSGAPERSIAYCGGGGAPEDGEPSVHVGSVSPLAFSEHAEARRVEHQLERSFTAHRYLDRRARAALEHHMGRDRREGRE